MTKTIASKVMWIGRAAVFTIGLAVTLTLMFGATTTALAAVPGDPFKLGQPNAVNAASTLLGSVRGAMLTIENQAPASKGAVAPALSLKVAPNSAPLTANPQAGTATDLSADELDGRDQSAFFSGKTYEETKGRAGSGGNTATHIQANCDPGDRVLGGGFLDVKSDGEDHVAHSRPIGGDFDASDGFSNHSAWFVTFVDLGPGSYFEVHALCADFPPLR